MPATGDSNESVHDRDALYEDVGRSVDALLAGCDDWIAAMATVVCELHGAFEHYDWTGFYRRVGPQLLRIGPYQGSHGCLEIPFSRGVCGAAARTRKTQLVADVRTFPDHIACSATTLSEIVVPVMASDGEVIAVLDVDSDALGAFDERDRSALEALCAKLGQRYGEQARAAWVDSASPSE